MTNLSSLRNPTYAVSTLEDLRSAFEALEYTRSIADDFASVRTLLQRLRAVIESVFGADSPNLQVANRLQFRHMRAKQKNAVKSYDYEKSIALSLLSKMIDDIRLAHPDIPHQRQLTAPPPTELPDNLARFRRDHPESSKVAFIMMSFAPSEHHRQVTTAIKQTLAREGIVGIRADDKMYQSDLFPNILTYMHGCGFGVAVFDTFVDQRFNPNVAFEVGYMLALQKPVCIFKDEQLEALQADLIGKLYHPISRQAIEDSVDRQLSKWLSDLT